MNPSSILKGNHLRMCDWSALNEYFVRNALTDPVITECYSMQVHALVAQLRKLQESIKMDDREIHKINRAHADAEIISSFPGTGKVFGPRLIALAAYR